MTRLIAAVFGTLAVGLGLGCSSSSNRTETTSPPTQASAEEVAPTATGDTADAHLAPVVSYTMTYDLDALPASADGCSRWFDAWAQDYLGAEIAAAESGDLALMNVLAGHRAAAATAVSRCVDGQPVDLDDLAVHQTALEDALP